MSARLSLREFIQTLRARWRCRPARPAGLPAAARTALLVPTSAAPLPSAPEGLPKAKSTAVSPAPTFREWHTVASVSVPYRQNCRILSAGSSLAPVIGDHVR
jgi:hypothetical protein